MKKKSFFIFLLSISALFLAGTAAYFSVFGLSKLFYAAGIGIIILAASLEFAKVVTVSYVYQYWKHIEKSLRGFYVFAVVFIMFLTSVGVYSFLAGSYQKSANKIEYRDSQIKIMENKKNLFINQLDRINKSIESSGDRINTLSNLRNQQEDRLNNLYNNKILSGAKRTENQITGSDEQIKLLNDDITKKMSQTSVVNDSISYYDQKIIELKSSDVSNEIGPYKFISDLTGLSVNVVVNIVALIIIFVFDPLAIGLLMAVNRLSMVKDLEESSPMKQKKYTFNFKDFLNKRRKKKEKEEILDRNIKEKEIEYEKDDDFLYTKNDNVENLEYDDDLYDNDNEAFIERIDKDDKHLNKYENRHESFSLKCPDSCIEEKIDIDNKDVRDDMIIYHNIFGKGKVIKSDLSKNRVLIQFEDLGLKELNTGYVSLKEVKFREKSESDVYEYKSDDNEKQEDVSEQINEDEYEHVKYVDPDTPWLLRTKNVKKEK